MSTTTKIPGNILKEGYLLKRSKHLKQWRNRWVQISDECILYSFRNRNDKKPSQIVDLHDYQIIEIVSPSNNNKKKCKSHSSNNIKNKQKETKLNNKKLLENRIIELSSSNPHIKTIYQFKTLMYLPWFDIFKKCLNIINNIQMEINNNNNNNKNNNNNNN
eukprot:62304_1